ncbi:helix-turn-helix domain-containing protein [Ruegeria arenilitoris]|uniref:helix-turn-helix domain-containing protein n=1 Tax=Ruegeria arenilitoris TaxID=1173585 RepID=UPI001479D727
MHSEEPYQTRLEIGKRIRRLRRKIGLTQCELAESLGHNSSTRVNQVELGRIRLYAEELPKLCSTLKCSLSDVVEEGISQNKETDT